MEFKRNKVATALACLLGAGGVVWLPNAFAQAVNPDVPSSTRPPAPDIRVDVTGSNIKRVEGEGALPVTIITRDEIQRSGATTAAEVLQLLSSNNSSSAVNLTSAVGATTFSAQTASLRGLGGGRTLVLLNGHRLEGFAGEITGVQGVNLAAVPFAAIERVEVLKDGASAIYGSDAIAGVINFITRNDYTGAEVTGFYGSPTRGGGGEQWQGSVSAGWGDLNKDRWNAFISGSYNEQKSLDQNRRDFSNSSYIPEIGLVGISSNTFPGRITTGGIGVVSNGQLAAPNNCGFATFFPDLEGCYFDPSRTPGVNMIANDKQYNLFASGRFQINSNWQAYLQGNYSHDETHLVIQPGPVSSIFTYGPLNNIPTTITLQPTSPFYPHQLAADAGVDGEPLDVRYRTLENGFRDTTDTNEHFNVVGGFKGNWAHWDWDASLFYSEGKTKQRLNGGFQDYTKLLPLLNSGRVNLFGFNTPEIHDELLATNFVGDTFHGTTKSYGAQVVTSGEIWKLPAGPLALAGGLETHKEEFDQIFVEALNEGNITGYGGPIKSTEGKNRTQWAVFGELNIPIVKTLEGNVAVRYDHYSDFGSTTNPKFSLRWQPLQSVLVRGSWGTGFLAPTLYQSFTPQFGGVSLPGQTDPIRCPVTNDTGLDCDTQFNVLFGGNAQLKPEESEQATLGFVFEPIPGASFSIDYFKINLKNAIQTGIAVPTILADLSQFGSLVTRGPDDPNFPGLPGRITSIDQTYINLGAERIQGLDIEAHYRAPTTDWGRLSFNLAGTYYLRYDVQRPDGSYYGQVGNMLNSILNSLNTGVIPRWKHYASMTWDQGPWSATIAQTYQTSYTDYAFDGTSDDCCARTVGGMSIWDLQGSYTGFKNWKLALGVKNMFDTNPPRSNQQGTFVVGFDPTYYDPRGRFVYGAVTYTFK